MTALTSQECPMLNQYFKYLYISKIHIKHRKLLVPNTTHIMQQYWQNNEITVKA